MVGGPRQIVARNELPCRQLLTMDASLLGWGPHLGMDPKHMVKGGNGSQHQLVGAMGHQVSIKALPSLPDWFAHVSPHGQHNSQGQGGMRSRSLIRKASPLFLWAESSLASIRVEHLVGVKDIAADWLSRQPMSNSRVVVALGNVPPSGSKVRSSRSGSLHLNGQHSAAPLFLPDPVQRGLDAL